MPPHGKFAQTKNKTKISHEIFLLQLLFFFFEKPLRPPNSATPHPSSFWCIRNRPHYYSFQQGSLKLFTACFISLFCLACHSFGLFSLLLVTPSAFLQHKQNFVQEQEPQKNKLNRGKPSKTTKNRQWTLRRIFREGVSITFQGSLGYQTGSQTGSASTKRGSKIQHEPHCSTPPTLQGRCESTASPRERNRCPKPSGAILLGPPRNPALTTLIPSSCAHQKSTNNCTDLIASPQEKK